MSSVNKVILVGRLGNNPEVRTMPDGNAVANISIATSEVWTDKQTGEKKEIVEWHRVVLFRRLAEITGQYLTKGSLVYIEGKLKTRKWQDPQTGQDRYTTEIQAESLQMLGSKSDAQSQAVAQNGNNAQSPNETSTVSQTTAQDTEDDSIPF